MKKVLLTLAVTCFAFAASAQIVIGGQIGFNTNSGNSANHSIHSGDAITAFNHDKTWDEPANSSASFTFMPKIGYNLNEKMQVGAQLGFTYNTSKTYNVGPAYTMTYPDAEDWSTSSNLGFTIAPYFRYNVAEMGKFTFFCEAQLSFSLNGKASIHDFATKIDDPVLGTVALAVDTTYKGNTSSNTLGITITPGLNYKLTDKISMDIYIDLLRLGFTHSTRTTFTDNTVGTVVDTQERVTTRNDFYFIANANAQTVRDHLDFFRIGFNYAF